MASGEDTAATGSFFDELKVWSEIKLRVLQKYLDAYMRKRGNYHSNIFYVDGFAGKGYYGEGRGRRDGSPVIMARFAQELALSGRGWRLTCINVEINPRHCAQLKRALANFDPTFVEVRRGAFADHLTDILTTCGKAPAVFFLDPFGVKAIRLIDLQPLLRRPDTELLLNINTKRLRLMAGFEDSDAKDRRAKLRLVSQVLGDNPSNPAWLAEWRRLGDAVEWERWAAMTYAQRLTSQSPYLQFAVTYPVRETFRGNPKYHLVFATRSFDAVPILNDLLCTEEDDLFTRTEAVTDAGQLTLMPLFREAARDERLTALLDDICAYGHRHQGCTRPALIRDFVLANFGQFKLKHFRQAIDRVVADGRAQFTGQGT